MLYQDRSRVDFMPNTNYVDGSVNQIVHYDWKGYGAFGVDVDGTITGGQYLLIQGSSDGENWTTLFTVLNGSQVTNNEIVTAGHYICNIVSFQLGRITTSTSFTGNVKLTANIGVEPPQIVANVMAG